MPNCDVKFDGRTVAVNPNPNPPPPKKEGVRLKPPPNRVSRKPLKDAVETREDQV